ncbi:4-hydroxy-3-methylbut-2-enyl diphosphate reductase [Gynurincola endophyticus]|uniref:4-hydroxy-3-methylbut-2-enyl diphosphate reductase n=1 Tax=Gynurincola endophyticus TaxID=2479004 RepID=UPI000F8E20DF|nr:4-hydroxy-3-methylbut-2-enyl diphosphate reductase [Gynurincola endophyticus]
MKTFNVPITYRSPLITAVKNKRKAADKMKKDFTPTLLEIGPLEIYLARHFGFCYGVENAIEIAFRTIDEHPDKKIYLLSEMIHNPQVNADLKSKGVEFLQDTKGNQLIPFDSLSAEDIAIIPAFGTTTTIESQLKSLGIPIEKYNTTCPFVEKVWNRSEQIATKGYSIIIHGKPQHEETRATFSHAGQNAPAVVVNDMHETELLAKYIRKELSKEQFYKDFAGRYTEGFDPETDLTKIGVVNQTTQLATDTQAIAEYLKNVIREYYQLEDGKVQDHFADTRDTLCYATNDNQTAMKALLETPADLAIVVGGYNSSNTTHLVELCEEVLPVYFINSADKLVNQNTVLHYNYHTKHEQTIEQYLPVQEKVRILMSSGASCPDAIVEGVIRKLAGFYGVEHLVDELIETI